VNVQVTVGAPVTTAFPIAARTAAEATNVPADVIARIAQATIKSYR
jgi:hypothetical protein